MRQFYQCLVIGLALALSAAASLPVASAAPAVGTVTGSVYTHGSERGMKIASAPDASAGGISWDLAAPKNKFHDKEADVWLIGKDFTYDELSSKEIADYYRKRWDIEVFFRFLKQELNLSHLVSLNKNGIEVMVYMTMIASMLLLIYKKANALGYKTAKRRIAMELRDMITEILIIFAGGDPGKVFKT